jgi:thymidine kinase
MAKLYFRFGTVGSAKTLNLLAVAHNYRMQNKRVLLLKPRLDDRFGDSVIQSRAGLQMDADLLLDAHTVISLDLIRDFHCVLVDEAQFLASCIIDQLRLIAHQHDVPVICYGLRTDFRRNLFAGAQRLMELADSIEEVKSTCAFCNKKAIFNLKLVDGVPTVLGPTIELGTEEKYLPACGRCYDRELAAACPEINICEARVTNAIQ